MYSHEWPTQGLTASCHLKRYVVLGICTNRPCAANGLLTVIFECTANGDASESLTHVMLQLWWKRFRSIMSNMVRAWAKVLLSTGRLWAWFPWFGSCKSLLSVVFQRDIAICRVSLQQPPLMRGCDRNRVFTVDWVQNKSERDNGIGYLSNCERWACVRIILYVCCFVLKLLYIHVSMAPTRLAPREYFSLHWVKNACKIAFHYRASIVSSSHNLQGCHLPE